jgi:hypothetical protein
MRSRPVLMRSSRVWEWYLAEFGKRDLAESEDENYSSLRMRSSRVLSVRSSRFWGSDLAEFENET